MEIKSEFKKEKIKILVMVILIAGACFLTYYFHAVVSTGRVFTHLFYIPIILSALWWKRKGLIIAIFLAAYLIFSHFFLRTDVETINDLYRAPMFILISVITIFLTEKVVKVKDMLWEKNDYLEKLINHANAPIIVWDKEGNIIRFNTAFEDLTKYQSSELIGKHFTTIFNGRTEEEVLRKIEQTLKGEYLKSVEITILDKNGSELMLLLNSANIYSSDGKNMIATIAQGTDITERKRDEEALAASKTYTESIIQNFLDTLIVVDIEAKIETVNPATCDLLGYTKEELIGQPITIIFEAEEEEEVVVRFFQFFREPEKVEDLNAQDTVRNRELTYKTKDGRLIPMLFNASIVFDDMGDVTSVVAGAKDITDIKRAEAVIKKEINFSKNIIATIPDPLVVVDKDLKVKSANRSFYEIFQMEPENVISASITEILGDKDGELSTELLKLFGTEDILDGFELQYQSKRSGLPREVRSLTSQGKMILNVIARTIIFAEEEEEEEELIVLQDITSRKQAEEKLQRFNEELEQKVTERTAELDKKIIESEQQRKATLNILQDVEGVNIKLIQEISEREHAEQIQKVLYNISNAVVTTDNLETLIGLIQKELGTIIDTTNFYVALYDKKTDMLSLPFYADEKDKFTSVPAGKTLTKYVIETKRPLLANIDVKKRFVKEGKLEYLGSLSKIWLGVPLKIEGKVTGAFAVQSYTDEFAYDESDMEMLEFVSDQISISIDRKKAEQDLIYALEKATESDRLKSAFLTNMSHEIRTPMNGILGFANLLKEPGLTSDNQQKYISIIEKSGDRMLNTINDIIDVSRIEAGQIDVHVSEVNINEKMEYLHTFFKPEAGKKGIQLSFKNGLLAQEAIVKTDRDKLYAILTNLVKNAIKYTHEGSIEFGYISTGSTAKSKSAGELVEPVEKTDSEPVELEFFVKDTGIGIPKDRQQAIFDRFVQADIEDKQAMQGSGLGLSISKAYVEILGGKIWLESEVGKGSQFYFTIPYNIESEKGQGGETEILQAKNNVQIKGLKILVAEDEDPSDMYLSLILKKLSKEILHTKTGTETVETCRKNPDIDLVLMDIMMPEMDGYEATRKIREFNKDVIIIAQTAYAIAGDREKSLDAGCDDYISKPIKKDKLLEMIGKHFEDS